jgi:hypothetical protein
MTDSKVPPRSQSALDELWGLSINWAFPRPTSNDGQCNIVWGGTAISAFAALWRACPCRTMPTSL